MTEVVICKTNITYIMLSLVTDVVMFSDGVILNSVRFPIAAVETHGAILFADLPGYSKCASQLEPVECSYVINHFFGWFEGEGRRFGGSIDKFIGDEVMLVFPHDECKLPPLQAAMQTARAMLAMDPFAFNPKIGIATGPFAIAAVGNEKRADVSAIGHTVNLAARCVGNTKGDTTIRIATDDIGIVKDVFRDDVWDVRTPELFEPKNMPPVKVVDVFRTTKWVPQFDYLQDVKKNVKFARERGVIKKTDT